MNSQNNHLLFNLTPLALSIGAILIGITLFIVRPDAQMQKDIALIQKDVKIITENHLIHIQDDVRANQTNIKENTETIQEINRKLDQVIYILEVYVND